MQTRIDPGKRTARYHFESLGEFGGWIETAPRTWRSAYSQDARETSKSWDLNAGYDGAVRMARNGWLEGAERVQEALKAFPPKSPSPDTRTDVYGFRPHVPRFCAGAPDSMIRHADVAETGAGRVLTLVVPINASSGTDAQYMANFGVACVQYVNQLETEGTRVELIACSSSSVSNWRLTQTITIKHADQPLDLAVIAFAIGHPAMFRRLGFAAMERSEAPEQSNYGMSLEPVTDDLINAPPGVVVLEGMKNASTHATTVEKGLQYVTAKIDAALKKQEL